MCCLTCPFTSHFISLKLADFNLSTFNIWLISIYSLYNYIVKWVFFFSQWLNVKLIIVSSWMRFVRKWRHCSLQDNGDEYILWCGNWVTPGGTVSISSVMLLLVAIMHSYGLRTSMLEIDCDWHFWFILSVTFISSSVVTILEDKERITQPWNTYPLESVVLFK